MVRKSEKVINKDKVCFYQISGKIQVAGEKNLGKSHVWYEDHLLYNTKSLLLYHSMIISQKYDSGCVKKLFYWKLPWKLKNCNDLRMWISLNCPCKTQVHWWLANTMNSILVWHLYIETAPWCPSYNLNLDKNSNSIRICRNTVKPV